MKQEKDTEQRGGGGGGGGGGSGEEEDMKRNKQPQQQQPQQQPPLKCPRCDSLNTKFCYYNNYSLTQPRYFCKTCKRYWTQGGTLRNVPVGGGCRKGKRARTTATTGNTVSSSTTGACDAAGALRAKETNLVGPTAPPPPGFAPLGFGSYNYPAGGGGGGFLSSLTAIQSLSHPGVSDLGKDLLGVGGGGGEGGGSSSTCSNLSLLMHGLNSLVPSLPPQFGSQLPGQQSTGLFYHMVGAAGRDDNTVATNTTAATTSNTSVFGQGHPLNPQEDILIQSRELRLTTAAPGSSSSHQHLNWPHHHQGFMVSSSSSSYPNVSDTSLWSISTTATTTTSTTVVGSSSLNPNQWHDLSGYGPRK